jgi:hypothetical protein
VSMYNFLIFPVSRALLGNGVSVQNTATMAVPLAIIF